jgi:hypothetical protein
MSQAKRRILILALLLPLLSGGVCLLGWLFLPSIRLTLLEQITGNTPAARTRAYVEAVLRGDEEAALAAWELPSWELPDGRSTALAERRQAVTRELIAADLQEDFLIRHTEWWNTCCEPGVICDPRNAGGARIAVQFLDQRGLPVTYVFDVFHRDGPYWGAAAGHPPRHWVLRDVYAQGQEPLFWRMLYEPEVRHLSESFPTPTTPPTPTPPFGTLELEPTTGPAPGTDAVIDCAAVYPGLPGCLQDESLISGRLAFVDARPPFDYRTTVIDLQHGGAWTLGETPGAPHGWSPSGEYLLASLGEGASAVYRYDGEVAATYGIPHPTSPFWAPPDGFPGASDWLARPTENGALEAIPFPEGQPRQLLPPGTLGESRLVNVRWSPADWLAWTLDPDQLAETGQWEQILYARPADGSAEIAAWRLSDNFRKTYYHILDWAPGTHLILAGRGMMSISLFEDGGTLVTINADTGEITDLGATMLLTLEAYAWHPTQPGLLALAEGSGRFINANKRLALLDVTTSELTYLISGDTVVFEPAWSPNGTLLAFAAIPVPPGDVETIEQTLNGRTIYVVDRATGESRALTGPGDGVDGWPQWSADGTHLLYTRQHDGYTDVRVVALDGSRDELLVTGLPDPECFYRGCNWQQMLAYFPGP